MKPEDGKLEEALRRGAEKLDGVDAPTPGFAWFKGLVDRGQARLRRAQRRQLVLFVAVALALVAGLIFCLGNYQAVFFALQGAAVLGAVTGLIWFFARKPKEGIGQ
jgi:hypothetical protein